MRMWRSGSASPCQGEGREFESRHPLEWEVSVLWLLPHAVAWPRGEATACKAVYTGSNPVATSDDSLGMPPQALQTWAVGAAVARFPDTEEVAGSIPVPPTRTPPRNRGSFVFVHAPVNLIYIQLMSRSPRGETSATSSRRRGVALPGEVAQDAGARFVAEQCPARIARAAVDLIRTDTPSLLDSIVATGLEPLSDFGHLLGGSALRCTARRNQSRSRGRFWGRPAHFRAA